MQGLINDVFPEPIIDLVDNWIIFDFNSWNLSQAGKMT